MMWKQLLILNICSLVKVLGDVGDSCRTKTNTNGICQRIIDCPIALKEIRKGNHPTICNFQNTEPIICCDKKSNLEVGIISKKKCLSYQTISKPRKGAKHIIGGKYSRIKEFPHMVALGFGDANNVAWECGGTLISDQFVLTAAHCLHSRLHGVVKFVRAGTVNLKGPSMGGMYQDFNISQVIPHPMFNEPSKYNDIALLKLSDRIIFDSYVKPACLDMNSNIEGVNLIATGWGFLEPSGNASDNLMKVELVKFDYKICNRTYFHPSGRSLANGILEESQLCAGGKFNEEKDTCHGDSGGPLQIKINGQYIVVGVTSFGKVCGVANLPGVYTKVSNYITWIENIVRPQVINA